MDPISYEEKNWISFQENWSWYHIVSNYCEDDLIKIQKIMDIELKAFLNHLSYKVSKQNLKK